MKTSHDWSQCWALERAAKIARSLRLTMTARQFELEANDKRGENIKQRIPIPEEDGLPEETGGIACNLRKLTPFITLPQQDLIARFLPSCGHEGLT